MINSAVHCAASLAPERRGVVISLFAFCRVPGLGAFPGGEQEVAAWCWVGGTFRVPHPLGVLLAIRRSEPQFSSALRIGPGQPHERLRYVVERRQQRVQLVVYAGDGRRHGAVFGLQHAEPQPQQRAQSRPRFSVALPLRIYRTPIPFYRSLFCAGIFPPRAAFGKGSGQTFDRPVVGQFDIFRKKAGRELSFAAVMRHALAAVSVTGASGSAARTSRILRALFTFHGFWSKYYVQGMVSS